jgi:uncharacterized protein (DUF1330 family)
LKKSRPPKQWNKEASVQPTTTYKIESCKMSETVETKKPAYLIISATILAPEKMEPYMKVAGPIFAKAGVEELAFGTDSEVQVLEGDWPFKGSLMAFKCTSMEKILEAWNSPEYQEAKKLREGVIESHFAVAIEPTR